MLPKRYPRGSPDYADRQADRCRNPTVQGAPRRARRLLRRQPARLRPARSGTKRPRAGKATDLDVVLPVRRTQKRLSFYPAYLALGLAAARQRAVDALAKLAQGKDPAAAKAATKAAAAQRQTRSLTWWTCSSSVAWKRRAAHLATSRKPTETFDNHVLPRWGEKDIHTITRRDVTELLDAVWVAAAWSRRRQAAALVPGGPIAANRTLAAIRALFNFALRRGIIDATPVALVERPGEEKRRDRTLAADEARAVWEVSDCLGYPFGPFFTSR